MQALLRSVAHGSFTKGSRLDTIPGSPPDLANLPAGCVFADRCQRAGDECRQTAPDETWITPDHRARCFKLEVVTA